MVNNIRLSIAVLATAILTTVGLSTPATASGSGTAVAEPTFMPAQYNSALECPAKPAFCLFSHPSRPKLVRYLPAVYPRNTCVNVSDVGDPIDTYDNATGFVWYGYHTHNCLNGHVIQFQPGWTGGMLGTFGRDWAEGRLHGVMRTTKR